MNIVDNKSLGRMGAYATVVIDPPWPNAKMKMQGHGGSTFEWYEKLTIPQIRDLPIPKVLADDAFVFLWTIQRFLPDAFDLFKAWGVRYRFTMTWHKSGGPSPLGLPTYNAEFVLVGDVGKPQFVETKAFAVSNDWPRQAHSQKPDGFYDLLRRVTVEPRLDVFARREIEGFKAWGNEAPCQEHDWMMPPASYRSEVWEICQNCGEVRSSDEVRQPLGPPPVWPGFPRMSEDDVGLWDLDEADESLWNPVEDDESYGALDSEVVVEDDEIYEHDNGWVWDYAAVDINGRLVLVW